MRHLHLLLLSAVLLLLCGCSKKDAAMDNYLKQMSSFSKEVSEITDSLAELDAGSPDDTKQFLVLVDRLDDSCADMATFEVPDEFSNVTELAYDASSNISKAASIFHEVFESEDGSVDEGSLEVAKEYFKRGFKRIDYIGVLLRGELPEGEDVTVLDD